MTSPINLTDWYLITMTTSGWVSEWFTVDCDVVDVLVVSDGHVSEIREDDKPREETGERVDSDSHQTVTETHRHRYTHAYRHIRTDTDRYRGRHRHSEDSSFVHFLVLPFDAHKHPVPDRVKPVMYNFSHPGTLDTQGWASECPDVKNYKWPA